MPIIDLPLCASVPLRVLCGSFLNTQQTQALEREECAHAFCLDFALCHADLVAILRRVNPHVFDFRAEPLVAAELKDDIPI